MKTASVLLAVLFIGLVAAAAPPSGQDVINALKSHNDVRQSLTKPHTYGANFPIAKSMPILTWDEGLATCAQNWADGKVFSHGGHNCSTVKGAWVGENLYKSMTTGKFPAVCPWASAVNSWFDEYKLWDNKTESVGKYNFSMKTGHFTAVVWDRTKVIGCGCSQYLENGWNTTYIVCEYFPGGNFGGQAIYTPADNQTTPVVTPNTTTPNTTAPVTNTTVPVTNNTVPVTNTSAPVGDIAIYLKAHNDYRQSLLKPHNWGGQFPVASEMPMLSWNESLAKCAQNWSDSHVFSHGGHNCSQNGWTGENLYISYTSAPLPATCDWSAAVKAWWDEYKLWDASVESVGKYAFSMKTGHFTAVAWGKTTQVGCGCARYKEGSWNTTYIVCEYWPGGNMIGSKIYA